ncbi:MAG: PspA/IM30 family protein [Anaerolineae bacterium]
MPGIFERISTILRANINDMLDHAEDPEKMINQIIRDMEDAIRDARSQTTEMLAQQKLLEARVADTQKEVNDWNRKAELAVQQNRDDLAREALRRSRDYQSQLAVYQQQLADQEALVARLRQQLDELESKYESAKRQRDTLIARSRAAKAKEQMSQAQAQMGQVPDYSSEMSRMEDKVRSQEAHAAASAEMVDTKTSVDKEFEQLEDPDIEAQLAALKTRVKGSSDAPPSGSQG